MLARELGYPADVLDERDARRLAEIFAGSPRAPA
jgi:hypothetical protein